MSDKLFVCLAVYAPTLEAKNVATKLNSYKYAFRMVVKLDLQSFNLSKPIDRGA